MKGLIEKDRGISIEADIQKLLGERSTNDRKKKNNR
jgi:hypothetical protein